MTRFMAMIWAYTETSFSVTIRALLTGWVNRNSAVRSFSSLLRMPAPHRAAKKAPPSPSTFPHSMA